MQYILVALCLVAACLTGCSGDKSSQTPAARVVDVPVRAAARTDVVECRSFPAQVESEQSVTLASKISGTVEAVMAREGDRLTTGAAIMRLDDKDLLSQRQGLFAEREQVSRERQALVARAGLAKTTMERIGRLLAQRAVSQEDFDKAKAEYDAVSRQIDAAAAKEQTVVSKLGELTALESYTRITAPFDGILARRYVDQGAYVAAGAPLALIDASAGGFELTAQVDESLLTAVRQGQTIIAGVPSLAPRPFAVTVSAIVGRIDPGNRTFKLKCALPGDVPGATGPPRAGMFGRVFVPARTVAKLLVPAQCLSLRGDLPLVAVADSGGTLRLGVVKTGGSFLAVDFGGATYVTDSEAFDASPEHERYVEIISGVENGDKLACPGTAVLRDGDRLPGAPQ
ncbi:efflux RND transporter periplasmic adaptor subunit [Desulfovibrio sp. TomC]|uniref:efflux RND transporter periplasmic adaptor subunit n=1 Tax=Desulfovibrio sp. TomC TaxID=1562888 RepID=UPI0005746104|nr:efflux RND transporter periplasmic adaptor subunit [Desulfovibrio sp. TomC]KHK00568.1 Efflux transporter, RND family, MFP subunit, AcrA/E family [Desulfovibrio sp. TomC]